MFLFILHHNAVWEIDENRFYKVNAIALTRGLSPKPKLD
jgi:hypothetical protein